MFSQGNLKYKVYILYMSKHIILEIITTCLEGMLTKNVKK